MSYSDYELCRAERRGGIYGLTVGGTVYALTGSGEKIPLPPLTAQAWKALQLDEPPAVGAADPWTEEDEAADYRRQAL